MPNEINSKEGYSIKLNMLFYWLKKSRRVWHNRLIEYLLKEFVLVFIWKDPNNEFAIIIVYVDDIKIVGTPNEPTKAIDYLKERI